MEAHEQALLLEMIPIFPPIRVEQVTALYIYIHTYIHLSLSLSLVDLAGIPTAEGDGSWTALLSKPRDVRASRRTATWSSSLSRLQPTAAHPWPAR